MKSAFEISQKKTFSKKFAHYVSESFLIEHGSLSGEEEHYLFAVQRRLSVLKTAIKKKKQSD